VPRTFRVPAALLALAFAGWVASALAMRGMSSMGGPGSLVSFLWLWVVMSTAMMLPALVPAASLATVVGRSSTAFVGSYLAVWSAAGVLAFEAARTVMGAGRWPLAVVVAAAGLYQLTSLKDACLRRCRAPLGTLMRRGSVASGVEHGVLCLGCCWLLMLAFLALGAASLVWMAVLSVVIFIEKATPIGARAVAPVGLALIALGVWLAA
jgi:predicted metal-binding membrane protein